MRKQIGLLAIFTLGAATLYGQASRTWVSGVGDDANPCSRTAPCKTLAGAISKTAAGGEIDALDPGGFGAVTITKAITFDGGGGQVASVLVAGTNGIVVQAGASDVVTIRNFRINGLVNSGNGGLNGIRWLSGKSLHVEDCNIFGFNSSGIDIEKSDGGHAFIDGTTVANNSSTSLGVGIFVANTANDVQVDIFNSVAADNQFGVAVHDFGKVTITHSDISGNVNSGVQAFATTAGHTFVNVFDSVIAHNSIALFNGGAGNPVTNLAGTGFFGNATGVTISTGTVNSAGNNPMDSVAPAFGTLGVH